MDTLKKKKPCAKVVKNFVYKIW